MKVRCYESKGIDKETLRQVQNRQKKGDVARDLHESPTQATPEGKNLVVLGDCRISGGSSGVQEV
jgi:hypothetical protein